MFREGVNNLKLDKKDFEEAGVRSVSGGALEEELNPLTGEQKSLKGNYINKVDNELEKSEEEIIGQKLEKIGFFEKTKEGLSFDVDKINSFKMMNNQKGLYVYSGKKGYLNREDIFKFLNNQVGFVQGDPEKKNKTIFFFTFRFETG